MIYIVNGKFFLVCYFSMLVSGRNETLSSPNRCTHMKKFHLERTNEALVGHGGPAAVFSAST